MLQRYCLKILSFLFLWLSCSLCKELLQDRLKLPDNPIQSSVTPPQTRTSPPKKSSRSMFRDKKVLKIVEQKFMGFMGLKERPANNVTKHNVKVPDHLWKLYYKWSDENYQDHDKENADTARLFHHEEAHKSQKKNNKLHFNLTVIPKEDKLHRAELLLFNERRRSMKRKKLIHLYRTYVHNTTRVLAYVQKVRNSKKGYVKIDVTDLINDWRKNGIENSSVLVDVDRNSNQDNSVHIRKRRSITTEEWEEKRPMLIVYTRNRKSSSLSQNKYAVRKTRPSSKQHRRNRRNNINNMYVYTDNNLQEMNATHQRIRSSTCRLQPFRLDFKDCGWDEWIIAPDAYNINFCTGKCPQPLSPHFNTTNHAVIQNAYISVYKDHSVPGLCCIPTSFKDQTFLYLDNTGKLLLKTPKEMIALGCGCR